MGIFIFVYGTLKKGKRAHHLLSGAKLIGSGIVRGYDMYIVSDYPGIVKGEGTVKGEVYEVDEDILKKLDEYEGVPLLYTRIEDTVKLENGRQLRANIYLYKGKINTLKKAPVNEKGEYEF